MTRPFLGLFVAAFGGIGLVDRVNNTASALANWTAETSDRVGFNVSIYSDNGNRPYEYLVKDVSPQTPETLGASWVTEVGWALWVCPKRKGCPRQ